MTWRDYQRRQKPLRRFFDYCGALAVCLANNPYERSDRSLRAHECVNGCPPLLGDGDKARAVPAGLPAVALAHPETWLCPTCVCEFDEDIKRISQKNRIAHEQCGELAGIDEGAFLRVRQSVARLEGAPARIKRQRLEARAAELRRRQAAMNALQGVVEVTP